MLVGAIDRDAGVNAFKDSAMGVDVARKLGFRVFELGAIDRKADRAALAVQPSFRPARLELGKILLTLGRDREAIPVLLPALQVDDSYTPVVLMFLAQAYRTTGDRQNALEYLKQAHERALKTGPPNLLAEIERELAQLGSHP